MISYDIIVLILFAVSFAVLLTVDFKGKYKNCSHCKDTWSIIPVVVLHRLIWFFSIVGWLFNAKWVLWLYIAVPVIAVLHWITNKWRCTISQVENKICGFPKHTRFDRDLGKSMKTKPVQTVIIVLVRILFFAIAVIKLMH